MLFTPLEQFSIISIIPIKFGNFDISFTNSSLFMLISVSSLMILLQMAAYKSTLIPNRWQSIVEMCYEFVLTLVKENVGPKGYKYFPFVFVLFTFILFCNLIGMVPYSFTVTSHIVITFGLSLTVFIGVTIIGFRHHKIHFFSLLMPPGAPLALAPLLVMIELVSYVSRAFSLAIRLFANMMSGHTLVKILAGFGWSMLTMGGIFYVLHLVPVVVVFAITGLEIGIAILQAYVFTILTCLYLNDSINLH